MKMSSYDDLTKEEKTELSGHSSPAFLFVVTGILLTGISYLLGWILMGLLGVVTIGMGVVALINMCRACEKIVERNSYPKGK
ncbi:hypothetical protein C4577_06510 [Candidatus Parcubacteria bacterium]|nr:MAG: hypothetical protein C4577_06510 [Candidatus Parcubacteria bacterium]